MPNRPPELPPRHFWSGERAARLGFLVGLGLDARDVAEDPAINSTPGNVRLQARRLGLAFRAAAARRLPYATLARFDAAAARRGLEREDLIQCLLINAGSDDALIDNILDDIS